jgi:hypothetical protein
VDVDAVRPLIGNPVQLVRVPELGVPNTGVTRVGEVANTAEPEPVSSVNAVARLAELKEPNVVVVLTDVIAPVRFGILVVDDAVPVRAPTKPEVAVTIPEALMFVAISEVTVETPEELMLPVTLPVMFPEKPEVAVTIPEALILVAINEVTVETPEELMLPVTFPEKPEVAVTIPEALILVAFTAVNVETPLIFNEVKLLGAAAIAVSIVAVVVASRAVILESVDVLTNSEPLYARIFPVVIPVSVTSDKSFRLLTCPVPAPRVA